MRILVLEDEPKLGELYARHLREEGYAVDLVHNLSDAHQAFWDYDYDLLVLDRMVPGGDGLELAEMARRAEDRVPVLVLSALGSTSERIEGLFRGADDYLPKPIDLQELALRVAKVIVHKSTESGGRLRVGRVSIVPEQRKAFIDDVPIQLPRRRFGILEYLFLQGDRPVSAEELLEHVWDRHMDQMSGAVGPQMTRLRAAFRGVLEFRNIREVGYLVQPVEPDDGTAETHPSENS